MARLIDLDSLSGEQVSVSEDVLHIAQENGRDRKIVVEELLKKIPDASSTQKGIVNTSEQTFSGKKIFDDGVEAASLGGNLALSYQIAEKLLNLESGENLPVAFGKISAAISRFILHLGSDNHNIPRAVPKDITSYFTDGTFYKRLHGTDGFTLFEDLYVGDYFKAQNDHNIVVPASLKTQPGDTGTKWFTISDFDGNWNTGVDGNMLMQLNPQLPDQHHAGIVPGKGLDGSVNATFGAARMNQSDTTAGGFAGSQMFLDVLGNRTLPSTGKTSADATINEQLLAEFGTHLLKINVLLSSGINASGYNRFGSATGCSSTWGWYIVYSLLMSEIQFYGSIVWSSSGYDTGEAQVPLPLFSDRRFRLHNHDVDNIWLRDVATAASFCRSSRDGIANFGGASNASLRVRPRWVIG